MFNKQYFFLILLLISSQASSLFQRYPINYSPKRNLFNVLAQIQVKIQTGGVMSSVIELLDSIESEVRTEESNNEAVASSEKLQCQNEIDFRQKELNDANETLNSAYSQIASCNSSLTRAQTELSNNMLNQQGLNDHLTQLSSIRSQDEELYNNRVQDHNDAVDSINIGLDMLDEIYIGEATFAQLSILSARMLQQSIKLKATRYYSAVVSVFAQVASKKVLLADADSLEKVRTLLENLKSNVMNSLLDYQTQEDDSKNVYNKRVADIQASFDELTQTEKSIREQIFSSENCVATQSSISSSASTKLTRNAELLQQAEAMCSDFIAEFNDSSEKRKDELQLIDQIRQMVLARYGKISSSVVERADKNEFDPYQNDYTYKAEDFTAEEDTSTASDDEAQEEISEEEAKELGFSGDVDIDDE